VQIVKIVASIIAVGICFGFASPALDAKNALHHCADTNANGTGPSEKIAKFQVYEGLLQSIDMALWAEWMVSGTTQGYAIKSVNYECHKDRGLGISCRGKTTICKR
jgi:hypothetical protein